MASRSSESACPAYVAQLECLKSLPKHQVLAQWFTSLAVKADVAMGTHLFVSTESC